MECEESDSKKKIWSYDDLVKIMKPTPQELKYRKQKSKQSDFVQKYSKLFKCTKCQANLKSDILSNEKVPMHPCLGVLMCQNCCNYYEDGEFSVDSDGEDKYCRWCGEGGTIFVCSKCICGFCAACIKRHFGWKYFKKVEKDENWLCFFCNQKPLWDQRFICSLAIELSENVKSEKLQDSSKEIGVSGLESISGKSDTESERLESNISNTKKQKIKSSKKQNDQSSVELENSIPSSVLKSDPEESKILTPNDDSGFEVPVKRRKISSASLKEGSTSFDSQLTSEIKTSTPRFVLKIGKKKKKRSAENSEHTGSINTERKKGKKYSTSFESIKSNALSELKKILVLSKQQMNLGMNWSEKTLEKIKCLNINTPEELEKECQIVKWFLSTFSTYLVEFSNSVERVEKKLHKTDGSKTQQQDSPVKEHSDYTKILQILGFFSNQIKTFMEKGISLPDVIGAEAYDDQKIIGIIKKQNSSIKTSNEEVIKPSSSCNLKNNDNEAENNECTVSEEPQMSESDKSRDELLDLMVDEALEKNNDFEDMDKEDEDSSNTTVGELNDFKIVDREDIRQILAILENA